MTYPATLSEFNKRRAAFETWLTANGSAILATTNPHEVIRFVGQNTACVVYRDDCNQILARHWQNGADAAFVAFEQQKPWRAIERAPRSDKKRINLVRSIAARDGWGCCYCPAQLTEKTATLEHFLSKTHGGSDHLANLGLACQPCNENAHHLSVREKIEIAIIGRKST